jgi:hypothetical protein
MSMHDRDGFSPYAEIIMYIAFIMLCLGAIGVRTQ